MGKTILRSVRTTSHMVGRPLLTVFFFFFNDTATTEIYTLSLHDALPILEKPSPSPPKTNTCRSSPPKLMPAAKGNARSEEHTSELQSQSNLVCRLLLEKKKKRSRAAHDRTINREQAHSSLDRRHQHHERG